MAVKKEILKMSWMSHRVCLRVLWMLVGVIIMGGVYLLSYNNVDELAVTETNHLIDYIRTVLTK